MFDSVKTCSLVQSVTMDVCQNCEPLLSLAMLQDERLRSVAVQEMSCLDGDTEPDERLEGEGGVGEVPP